MPQITSHRRNLAAFLDPTLNIHSLHQPKSSSAAAAHLRPAPLPDPTIPTVIHTVIDSSCTALAKSKSQRGCNFPKKTTVKHQQKSSDEIKKRDLSLSVGRRRSFCSSEIELADLFSHNNVKVVSVDMAPFMQIHAVNFARKAYDSLEKFTPKALALTLKKEFDGVYGAAWHCIVGSSFGSFVTHSVGGFIYFSMDHKLHVLLFKTSIKRASLN